MIADDMMSFIKKDIVVFGVGVFVFIILTLWFIFRNIKISYYAITGLCNFSCYHGWSFRFHRMEGNSNFIKFYCLDAYSEYGNEYPFNSKISTNQKRIS